MRKSWIVATALLAGAWAPSEALAGRFEASMGFSFNQTNYGGSNFSWTRRWGASFGYHFSDRSEIEVSFQDVVDRTQIIGFEDTTFHDQIYAANWVQSLLGREYVVDPYFKVGIGQLNRDAAGTYAMGGTPTTRVDAVTGILGAGLRVGFTQRFGLRAEANTYLAGGVLSTWRDNVAVNIGFSVFF